MGTDCRIRVLPALLVNKIAAGEVVERPASVVKELIENAIDAGAGRVAVTIEDGGRQLIRVTDDGFGMTPEELRLAVVAHATSKIVDEEDLFAVATMGFRGEALASISAVSKLRIVSRPRDATEGHEVRMAGKEFESARAAGGPAGTTVEVRDLFFNVPARRRFLRSKPTEVGHINEQLARLALAMPQIAFELKSNGRVTQNLPPCKTRLERIGKFYGAELAADLIRIERNERGLEIEAYVAPPAQSRATAQWQYTFVNGRYIRDRYIRHALKEAYRGLTDPSRHAVVFLFLSLDPASLDVNVHPTKIEVRWADSNLIHSQVLSAIRETFQRSDLTPALRTNRATAAMDPAQQDRLLRETAAALKSAVPYQRPPPGQRTGGGSYSSPASSESRPEMPARSTGPSMDVDAMWRSLYGPPESEAASGAEADSSAPAASLGPASPARLTPPGRTGTVRRAIQMHNLYLVAETEDGIIIVDQHALHERVIYEQLRRRISEGRLESQRLLLPETLTVTPKQVALLESNSELLTRLGIEATPFGADAVAVHSFPSMLKDADVASFMSDLLDQLDQRAASPDPEQVISDLLDMMACKAAVKAGDPLTQEEIDALMQQRHLVENSSSCPHGRPTMLRLAKADLDRQFKRT